MIKANQSKKDLLCEIAELRKQIYEFAEVEEARKKTESALEECERRFNLLVGQLPTVLWITDKELKITLSLGAGLNALNLEPNEVVGISLYEYFQTDDAQFLPIDAHMRALNGESVSYEVEWGGQAYESHVRPLRKAGRHIVGVIGVANNITKYKQATGAAEKSEATLRQMLAGSPDLMLVLDSDGRYREILSSAAHLLYAPAERILGKTIHEVLPRKEANRIQKVIERTLTTGELQSYEYTLDIRGKSRWFSARVVPFGPSDRSSVLWVARDITERKVSEQQIRESLKEKELLLSELHHRVKNNLQVISSLLHLQCRAVEDESIVRLFQESQKRIEAIALVHEALHKSRTLGKINCARYVKSLVKNLFQFYVPNAHSIKLKLRIDEVYLAMEIAIPIGLIINELVSNALKYAFPSSQKGEIAVELYKGAQLTVVIQDTGVGLPKDFNLDNVQSLGLHLVKMLAKQLRGHVELNVNGGTQFRLTFENKTG